MLYRFSDNSIARVGQRAVVNGQRGIVLARDPGGRDPQLCIAIGESPNLFDSTPDKIFETNEGLPE